jgi:hypothetical protein
MMELRGMALTYLLPWRIDHSSVVVRDGSQSFAVELSRTFLVVGEFSATRGAGEHRGGDQTTP